MGTEETHGAGIQLDNESFGRVDPPAKSAVPAIVGFDGDVVSQKVAELLPSDENGLPVAALCEPLVEFCQQDAEQFRAVDGVCGFNRQAGGGRIQVVFSEESGGLIAINADADDKMMLFSCDFLFDQDTGDLLTVHENIIGPFNPAGQPAKSLNGIGGGHRGDQCQQFRLERLI